MSDATGASAPRTAFRTSGHAALAVSCRDDRHGLNAINQGDIVLTGEQPQWLKVALTYAVPFFVSSYGAYCTASVRGQRLWHPAAGPSPKRRARPTRHWQLAAGT
jgi:hypothetical protein